MEVLAFITGEKKIAWVNWARWSMNNASEIKQGSWPLVIKKYFKSYPSGSVQLYTKIELFSIINASHHTLLWFYSVLVLYSTSGNKLTWTFSSSHLFFPFLSSIFLPLFSSPWLFHDKYLNYTWLNVEESFFWTRLISTPLPTTKEDDYPHYVSNKLLYCKYSRSRC